jgi:hypothetical protein
MDEGLRGSAPQHMRNAGSKSCVANDVTIAFFGDCAAKAVDCQVFCGSSSGPPVSTVSLPVKPLFRVLSSPVPLKIAQFPTFRVHVFNVFISDY